MDVSQLKEELAKPGRSQSALARFLRIDAASANRLANGKRKISSDEADKIRAYLKGTERGEPKVAGANDDATWAQRLSAGGPRLGFLPIRFRVQAGAWHSVNFYEQDLIGFGPIARDPKYEYADQWLEEVVGESMDLLIKPGMLVHVVDAISVHYYPRQDDIVIIERIRHQGAEVERSVKQVVITSDGVEFWGRSTNDHWNVPVKLMDGREEDDPDVEVRIAGWVRNAILRF